MARVRIYPDLPLFIWYRDGTRDIIYRGGPADGSRYTALVTQGRATQYQAPTSETLDIDWPFTNLVTNRMVGLARNYDYVAWANNGLQARHMATVATGPRFCNLDAAFTLQTRCVGELGRTYNAVAVDRTDNSNATVYTIVQEMGLPLIKPAVHAPGWGTNLHRVHTVPESLGDSADEIKRELRWYDNLSPMDQVRVLQRMFGGQDFDFSAMHHDCRPVLPDSGRPFREERNLDPR